MRERSRYNHHNEAAAAVAAKKTNERTRNVERMPRHVNALCFISMNFALPSVVNATTANAIAIAVVVVIHLNCVSYSLSPIDVLIFHSNSTHWLATAVRNSIISFHYTRKRERDTYSRCAMLVYSGVLLSRRRAYIPKWCYIGSSSSCSHSSVAYATTLTR